MRRSRRERRAPGQQCHFGRSGQRGAALVEASIASLMFFSVLLAVFDFGWAFRDYLATSDIARSGSRVGSSVGNDVSADYAIVSSVRKGMGALNSGQLQYIVIFDAGASNAKLTTLSPTCAAGTSVAGLCNVYRPADLLRPLSDYGCSTTTLSPDRFWCPSTRRVNASVATGGPPNFLGVYVKVKHQSLTSFLGTSVTFTDQAILRIEPEER